MVHVEALCIYRFQKEKEGDLADCLGTTAAIFILALVSFRLIFVPVSPSAIILRIH